MLSSSLSSILPPPSVFCHSLSSLEAVTIASGEKQTRMVLPLAMVTPSEHFVSVHRCLMTSGRLTSPTPSRLLARLEGRTASQRARCAAIQPRPDQYFRSHGVFGLHQSITHRGPLAHACPQR